LVLHLDNDVEHVRLHIIRVTSTPVATCISHTRAWRRLYKSATSRHIRAGPVAEEAAQRVGDEVDEQLDSEEGRESGVEAVKDMPLLRLRPALPPPQDKCRVNVCTEALLRFLVLLRILALNIFAIFDY
jgi:hypothetical protein